MARQAHSADLCQSCTGECCRTYDQVEVQTSDIARLAHHLELTPEAFERLAVVPDPTDSSRGIKKHRDRWCVFHSPIKGCTVYEARPDTCRGYMPPQCFGENAFCAKSELKLADIMRLVEGAKR